MNLRQAKLLTGVFAGVGVVGRCIPHASHGVAWFFIFLAFLLDSVISWKTGEVFSSLGLGLGRSWYHRDESPLLFMWAFFLKVALTFLCGLAALLSI